MCNTVLHALRRIGLCVVFNVLVLAPALAQESVFDEVWTLVNEHFYDASFNGLDWNAQKEAYALRVEQATTPEAKATLINEMLSLLDASHTHYYTQADPGYYALLDIFQAVPRIETLRPFFPDSVVSYTGIGMRTQTIDGVVFAKEVYESGPAHEAGILMGDAILSVNDEPYHPTHSFVDYTNQPVSITIQRTPDPASWQTLTVSPRLIQPNALFLSALEASIRIEEHSGKNIGYVHVWSYAGRAFHDALEAAVAFGPLKDADALVLDLRGGWGGASPTYLNLFNPNVPILSQTGRDGTAQTFDFQWRKPVVLLVNESSRSGKEILAHGFKTYEIGPVVGTRTAGAVVGGQIFPLSDGSVLYLATRDVRVNGERLEGIGVAPDVEVPFTLPYAAGRDPQLERAFQLLSEM